MEFNNKYISVITISFSILKSILNLFEIGFDSVVFFLYSAKSTVNGAGFIPKFEPSTGMCRKQWNYLFLYKLYFIIKIFQLACKDFDIIFQPGIIVIFPLILVLTY